MWKALLRKQFAELNQQYISNKKTGKRRSNAAIAGLAFLYMLLCVVMVVLFFVVGANLADALIPLHLDWLYFAMIAMISIALGVFGSVFNTYAGLFLAKDNELLLSMPIPPHRILVVRMIGVFAMSLLYSGLVWLPGVAAYWTLKETIDSGALILQILDTLVVTAFVSVLTCALGYLVALISMRIKNKSIIVAVLTVAFLAAYYYVYFQLNELLQSMVIYADAIGQLLNTWAYPIVQLALGACGSISGFLIFLVITIVLLAACILIMAKSFVKITTTKVGGKKTAYVRKASKAGSIRTALLRKEAKRLMGSATYLTNSCIGLIIMVGVSVFGLIKINAIQEMMAMFTAETEGAFSLMIPVLMASALVMILSMNQISAPSVSLEGKNIWILQTLPVTGKQVLEAKLLFHILMNAVPLVITVLAIAVIFELSVIDSIILLILSFVFCWFTGVLGLCINLKHPNLTWTNEAVPVKQSMAIFIGMFGGWAIAIAITAPFMMYDLFMNTSLYLVLWTLVLAAASFGMNYWMNRRGVEIFMKL